MHWIQPNSPKNYDKVAICICESLGQLFVVAGVQTHIYILAYVQKRILAL